MVATSPSAVRAIPVFLLTLITGATAFVFLDVQLSLAAMQSGGEPALPNMAPQVRYLFIPVLCVFVLLFAALVEPILRWLFRSGALASLSQYAALGFAYSTLVASLPLGKAIGMPGLVAGPLCAIVLAALLRYVALPHES